MSDIENKGVSPLEGEGLRGDGKANGMSFILIRVTKTK